MKHTRYILLGILLLAAILRLWHLGSVPPSPDWDEAALGYNAYSILKTGMDEYGERFPIIFRSFDDYKPGFYVYLTIPSILLFGLTTFAVRLPSALIGILAVWATHALVSVEWFRIKNSFVQQKYLALAAAFFMAISPWHIQFSRIAFEASVGMAGTIFGTVFFFKGLRNSRYWYVSAMSYGFAIYAYQSEKVFVPLLAICLIVLFLKELTVRWRDLIGPLLVFILIAGPFYYQTLANPDALIRAKGVSLFADQTPYLSKTVSRLERDIVYGDTIGYVFDNRRVTYLKGFTEGYISHFDINWLFLVGDQPRHQPPAFGHLYLFELPLILIGLYIFLYGNFSRRIKWFLLLWLLITPIPAAITTGTPHAIRTIHFLPGLHILSALGLVGIVQVIVRFRSKLHIAVAIGFLALGIVLNVSYYLSQYFIQYNYESSIEWQYGYADAVSYVSSIADSYDHIVVSNKDPMGQSYMFFLYYLAYDPATYIAEGGSETGGFAEAHRFDRYEFRPIEWSTERPVGRTLYVGRPGDIPDSTTILYTVNYLNGEQAIRIGEM